MYFHDPLRFVLFLILKHFCGVDMMGMTSSMSISSTYHHT